MASESLIYFTPEEFYKCTPSCSIDDMRPFFMSRLEMARELAGIPFVLNSAYRSVDWEKQHNRTGTSSHCKGVAVDVRCFESDKRYKIVRAALAAGFRRIGIARNFVHLDLDSSKPSSIWLYDSRF